jgi:hypothetical protein
MRHCLEPYAVRVTAIGLIVEQVLVSLILPPGQTIYFIRIRDSYPKPTAHKEVLWILRSLRSGIASKRHSSRTPGLEIRLEWHVLWP